MKPEAKNYNLQDFIIFNSKKEFDFFVWNPDKTYIVLGRANKAEDSVYIKTAQENNVEILKRPSGGESVILSSKTIVISVKLTIKNYLNTHKYFKIINKQIISALHNLGIKNLNMKGISDISIGEMKILGSSIYRKSDTLFYHAVLNVSESTKEIEKYLKHPEREPDYRIGRSHNEFVTSLKNETYTLEIADLKDEINAKLSKLSTLIL